jgi:Carboxypeptidase regulatory-like domain
MKIVVVALWLSMLTGIAASECVTVQPTTLNLCCTKLPANDAQVAVMLQGKPVRGATVEFLPKSGSPVSFTTDENGFARPEGLAFGRYRVTASHDGNESDVREVDVTDIAALAPTVTLRFDLPLEPEIPKDLPAGPRIQKFEGLVSDASGAVIPGAKVRVMRRTEGQPFVVEVKADANGRFSAELPEGSYIGLFFARAFQRRVVPFEVTKEGSQSLSVQLQVGSC